MNSQEALNQNFLEGIPTEEGSIEESYSDDFMELSHLGSISKEVSWHGHKFVIRTLKIAEEIAAAKLVKANEGTLAELKTTHAAVIAAAIVSINGQPFMPPISANIFENIQARYNYIIENWHWPTVEFLVDAHNDLVARQWEALMETQKKLATGQTDLFDLSGLSIDKESSEET